MSRATKSQSGWNYSKPDPVKIIIGQHGWEITHAITTKNAKGIDEADAKATHATHATQRIIREARIEELERIKSNTSK